MAGGPHAIDDSLRSRGFARFDRLVPQEAVARALSAIDDDLAMNFDPARRVEYDNRSFCPSLRGMPPIMGLIEAPPVASVLDDVFGLDELEWDRGQIAIRRARNHPAPVPPQAHVDGFPTMLNGLASGAMAPFTAVLGIFLTPLRQEFAGNYAAWPGSHVMLERHFRERGERAMREPAPELDFGRPEQLLAEPGDVILVHSLLAHAAAVNTSDRDRIAVYFRIGLRDVKRRPLHYLTNAWEGWRF